MTQPLPYEQWSGASPWSADLSHLKTLAICHYVWGGLSLALSSFFIIYIVLGVVMLSGGLPMTPPPAPGRAAAPAPPPEFLGWFFIAMGAIVVAIGWTAGICTILSGRCLARQTSRTFSLVMAGVNCLSVPFGTLLGVFTFIVLFRPSVQALYDQRLGSG